MAQRPIVFALANPDPEIGYPEAMAARPDAIVATGRCDFPNQVNNVLGFPYIFRGALDVRAKEINEAMKVAAAHALAALAREPVPDSRHRGVRRQGVQVRPRLLHPQAVRPARPVVGRARGREGGDGVGRRADQVRSRRVPRAAERRMGGAQHTIMRQIVQRAKSAPKRIVFPDGDNIKVLRACQIALDEGIAQPMLLGRERKIRQRAAELDLDLEGVEIIDPRRFAQARRLRRRVHGAALPQGRHRLERGAASSTGASTSA